MAHGRDPGTVQPFARQLRQAKFHRTPAGENHQAAPGSGCTGWGLNARFKVLEATGRQTDRAQAKKPHAPRNVIGLGGRPADQDV
jgi:hypothetical protein